MLNPRKAPLLFVVPAALELRTIAWTRAHEKTIADRRRGGCPVSRRRRRLQFRTQAAHDPEFPVEHGAAAGDRDGGGIADRTVGGAVQCHRHADLVPGRRHHDAGVWHCDRCLSRERAGGAARHQAGAARYCSRACRSRQQQGDAAGGGSRLPAPDGPDRQARDVGGQSRHGTRQARHRTRSGQTHRSGDRPEDHCHAIQRPARHPQSGARPIRLARRNAGYAAGARPHSRRLSHAGTVDRQAPRKSGDFAHG